MAQRVAVFSCFDHKQGINIADFGLLKIGFGFRILVLNWVCFFEDVAFSSLSRRLSIKKAVHQLCSGQLFQLQQS